MGYKVILPSNALDEQYNTSPEFKTIKTQYIFTVKTLIHFTISVFNITVSTIQPR